jgi:hypothetical protein
VKYLKSLDHNELVALLTLPVIAWHIRTFVSISLCKTRGNKAEAWRKINVLKMGVQMRTPPSASRLEPGEQGFVMRSL